MNILYWQSDSWEVVITCSEFTNYQRYRSHISIAQIENLNKDFVNKIYIPILYTF